MSGTRIGGWAVLLALLFPLSTLGDSFPAKTGRIQRAVGSGTHGSSVPVRCAIGTGPAPVRQMGDKAKEPDVVKRAEPSVYKVISRGYLDLTYPKEIYFQNPFVVEQWGERDPADCWRRLMKEGGPDKYLTVSIEKVQKRVELSFRSGTAFVISEEGVLITNAHMVADPEPNYGLHPTDLRELRFTNDLLEAPIQEAMEKITTEFGGKIPDEVSIEPLIQWLAKESTTTGRFTGGDVDVGYGHYLGETSKIFTTPFHVAYQGDSWGQGDSEDVALLVAPALKGKVTLLQLGDSDKIRSRKVWAMGFPGAAQVPGVLHESAAIRVTNTPGAISSNDKHIKDETWSIIEHSAQIDHGNSGGPLLDDESGEVIGVNAAGYPNTKAVFIAIPINVAWGFIHDAWAESHPPWSPAPVWSRLLRVQRFWRECQIDHSVGGRIERFRSRVLQGSIL